MCCAAEKLNCLIEEPSEPVEALFAGDTAESKRFLSNFRKYNSGIQLTSFGAEIVTAPFTPTFNVKGQIYHKAGSLLSFPDDSHKSLQIYFIGDGSDEFNARYGISIGIKGPSFPNCKSFFTKKLS